MIYNLDKNILSYLFTIVLISNFIFAGCGSCETDEKIDVVTKSSALVTTIPDSGDIEGFVLASCGICSFGFRGSKGCSLTIKIEDKVYPVEGTSIHKHGNPHSKEGFCSAVRVAYVSGNMKKNTFYSDSFTLMESPK